MDSFDWQIFAVGAAVGVALYTMVGVAIALILTV